MTQYIAGTPLKEIPPFENISKDRTNLDAWGVALISLIFQLDIKGVLD